MRKAGLIAASALLAPTAAWAGPPFLTDDPEPTDTGHWEIYAPIIEGEGKGQDYEGSVATEINYGPVKDVQITVGLPMAYSHDADGMHWGAGDLAVSVKYRFYNNEDSGVQIAFFPGMTLPTAKEGFGNPQVTALLPVWAQKDSGKWSVFGGGGYAINPGAGNKNYWTGGLAVTREVTGKLRLGAEVNRSGEGTIGDGGSTSLGLAAIWQLKAPFRLLARGGPTFADHGGSAGFHFFTALGLDF